MRELTIAKKAVGIDIGSHSVKAVAVSKRGASVVINRFEEIPVGDSGKLEPERVAAAVEQISQRLKIGSSLVVSGISTQKTTVRNLEIPFSEEEKARQILKFQTEPYLAFPIEEVIIDFHHTQSAVAGKMKVLLTAVHKGVVADHLKLLSRAEIDPEVVDVDFMAVVNSALVSDANLKEGSAIVLDVGATKTVACHIHEGELLAVRCITLGGDEFTEAIAKELGVPLDEAERLKTAEVAEEGSPEGTSERVRSAIRSVLDRLGAELDRTLRYFSSQARGGNFDRVILSGGSASLPGLGQFLGEALSAEVSVISPSETIKSSAGEELPCARFATALGLGLRGIGVSVCLQNFRQEEHAYARPLRRLRKSLAATGGLAIGTAALLVFSLFASLNRSKGRRSRMEYLIQIKRSTVFPDKTATDSTHMGNLLGEEEQKLTPFRELGRNVSILEVLNDLSERIPKEMKVELTLFDFLKAKPQKVVLGGRQPRVIRTPRMPQGAGTLKLQGTVASDVEKVELERILNESPYFGEVNDRAGVTPDPSGRRRFHFSLELKERPS